MQIKKRRLRRDLVTSRLSKPYAKPPTYISGRGNIKVVKCVRTTGSTCSIMRRAALLNLARRRQRNREETFDMGMNYQHLTIEQKAVSRTGSAAPSMTDCYSKTSNTTFIPLGLSNYEALDLDGDAFVDDPWVELGEEIEEEEMGDEKEEEEEVEEEVVSDYPDVQGTNGSNEIESHLTQSEFQIETTRTDTTTARTGSSSMAEENQVRETYPMVLSHRKSDIKNPPLYFLPYSASIAL